MKLKNFAFLPPLDEVKKAFIERMKSDPKSWPNAAVAKETLMDVYSHTNTDWWDLPALKIRNRRAKAEITQRRRAPSGARRYASRTLR